MLLWRQSGYNAAITSTISYIRSHLEINLANKLIAQLLQAAEANRRRMNLNLFAATDDQQQSQQQFSSVGSIVPFREQFLMSQNYVYGSNQVLSLFHISILLAYMTY